MGRWPRIVSQVEDGARAPRGEEFGVIKAFALKVSEIVVEEQALLCRILRGSRGVLVSSASHGAERSSCMRLSSSGRKKAKSISRA